MSWKKVASKVVGTARKSVNRASSAAENARKKGDAAAHSFYNTVKDETDRQANQLEEIFDFIETKTKGALVDEEQINAELIKYARQLVESNENAFGALISAQSRCSIKEVSEELFKPIFQGRGQISERDAADLTEKLWNRIIGDKGVVQNEWQWRDWLPHSLSIGAGGGASLYAGASGGTYLAFGCDRFVPYLYNVGEGTFGWQGGASAVVQLGLWRATNGQAYGSFIGVEGAFYGGYGGGVGVYFDPRIIPWIVIKIAELEVEDYYGWRNPFSPNFGNIGIEVPDKSHYPRAWQDFFQGGLIMGGVGAGLNINVALGHSMRTVPRIIYDTYK